MGYQSPNGHKRVYSSNDSNTHVRGPERSGKLFRGPTSTGSGQGSIACRIAFATGPFGSFLMKSKIIWPALSEKR
jgi:hypothetical protein